MNNDYPQVVISVLSAIVDDLDSIDCAVSITRSGKKAIICIPQMVMDIAAMIVLSPNVIIFGIQAVVCDAQRIISGGDIIISGTPIVFFAMGTISSVTKTIHLLRDQVDLWSSGK